MGPIHEVDKLDRYRWVFYAAAVYNAVWSIFVVLLPNFYFDLFRVARPSHPALWQCIGMLVGTFAIAYWLIARDPLRYGAFAWVGLLGKVLGPIGMAYEIMNGRLPLGFAWVCLTNDVIWWIPFALFLGEHYRAEKQKL